uniref:T9SS type A sorting domain-containing protein n=1 Tax=candidate division WOR-3 bacterium TaxID=2052148 RepID=A0A7C6EDC0_UNCW3
MMKRFFLVSAFLCLFVSSAFAEHKIYGLTFMGSPWDLSTNEMWNVQCWFDSLLKNHRFDTIGYRLDTVINLWDNARQRGPENPQYLPRYRRPFVTDTASVAKWNTYTAWLATRMDSTDLLFVMLGGHGNYSQSTNRCRVDAYGTPQDLYDTTVARALNAIPCKLRVIYIWSSFAFGNGWHPDSSGFGTVLALGSSVPDSIKNKTIFYSHAGPAPAWLSVVSDNRRVSGGPSYPGFENPIYGVNTYGWIEGLFPFQTVFDGGIEPSYYSGDSIQPGLYKDSIDLNVDNRLSAYEDSVWIHTWSSQLGWSSCPSVDLGRKAKRVCLWPYIGFIDSLDALPTAIFLPDTVDSGASITPLVRVKNLGFVSSNIPTRLRIGATYNQLRTKIIGPNQEDTLYFPNWAANQSGWITVRCSTELIGDEKPQNNLLRDSIYVPPLPIYDVGVTQIFLPDTADFGDTLYPQAIVKNFGNQTVSFPTVFRIGSVYSDTVFVNNLNPGNSQSLTFDQWPAESGTYLVKCSTALIGDQDSSNDAQLKTLFVRPPSGIPENWTQLADLVLPKKIKAGASLTYDGGQFIYATTGNNTRKFLTYDLLNQKWFERESVPLGSENRKIKGGSAICWYNGKVWLIKGRSNAFYSYDPVNNAWQSELSIPGDKKLKDGSALTTDGNWLYLVKGGTQEFYKFSPDSGWIALETIPRGSENKKVKKGGSLAYLDGYVWAFKGNTYTFWKYSLVNRTWLRDSSIPLSPSNKPKVKDGGALTVLDGKIYAFKGGNTQDFYEYTANGWVVRETIPKGLSGKKVKSGGALCAALGKIYAFKGNNTDEFWCYTPGNPSFWSFVGKPQEQTVSQFPIPNSQFPKATVMTLVQFKKVVSNSQYQIYDCTGRGISLNRVTGGIYFYRLKANNEKPLTKLVLIQ